MEIPDIKTMDNMTHLYHEVLEPFSVFPNPWMQSDVRSAANCFPKSAIANHWGNYSFPLEPAAVSNATLFLLHFLIRLPWSCSSMESSLSPSSDVLKPLLDFGLQNSSQHEQHFLHGQFEKILTQLEKHETANEENHDDHRDEKLHDDHKDDHNDTHRDDHEDDEHVVCLERLWPGKNKTISKEDAENLLVNLTLSLKSHFRFHCHEEGKGENPTKESFADDLLEIVDATENDKHEFTFDEKVVETILHKLRKGEKADGHDHDGHDHGGNDHDGHDHDKHDEKHDDHDHESDHRRRRRSTVEKKEEDHDHHEHEKEQEENQAGCYTAHKILDVFGLPKTGLKVADLYSICPAIVQQSLTTNCSGSASSKRSKPALSAVYGYGFLAVAVITLFSLVGVILVPCLSKSAFQQLVSSFICLAIGTMLGDSFLHLIPLSLGLHDHGSHDDHEDHSSHEDGEEQAFIWKMFVLLIAIYTFYLVETVFAAISNATGVDPAHGHSHGFVPEEQSSSRERSDTEKSGGSNLNPSNIANHGGHTNLGFNAESETVIAVKVKEVNGKDEKPAKKKAGICGIPTVSALVLIGDGIHNFVDGVAIAAAFSASLRTGWSTSLAILLHELPHEFGDFAIFINSGMGYKKALGLNLLSGLTAFLGFFLGVQIATDERIQLWIMCITAGMFIYVSLVNMLPEVMHNKDSKNVMGFLAQNVGIWIGIGMMLLIALVEDQIQGH